MELTTLVIILVLVAIAVVAVISVPLMIRSTRRQAVGAGSRRPSMGSPAQVWVERGERVLRELNAALAEHGVWQGVGVDATEVVSELRITAGQVAELDHALAQIADPGLAAAGRLRDARAALLARMEAAVAGMEQQLRLQYPDQRLGEYLVIGMEPLPTANGSAACFVVGNGGAGLIIIGRSAGPDAMVASRSQFVFAIHR